MSTGSDFVDKTWVKARTPHVCDECGGEILPGQTYSRHVQVYEGQFDRLSFCRRCENLWKQVIQKHSPDEYQYGSLMDFIKNDVEEVLWAVRKKWKAAEVPA